MSKEVKGQDLPPSPVISKADGIVHHVNIGYTAQLQKRRSLLSIMGMTLAIAAVPYGIGGTLMSAVRQSIALIILSRKKLLTLFTHNRFMVEANSRCSSACLWSSCLMGASLSH
jgi:hypothetical protein